MNDKLSSIKRSFWMLPAFKSAEAREEISGEAIQKLFEILNLTDKERQIIILSETYQNDKPLSQREIARRIGMSQPGVRKALIRIQKKISEISP